MKAVTFQEEMKCLYKYIIKKWPYPKRGIVFALSCCRVRSRLLDCSAWQECLCFPGDIGAHSINSDFWRNWRPEVLARCLGEAGDKKSAMWTVCNWAPIKTLDITTSLVGSNLYSLPYIMARRRYHCLGLHLIRGLEGLSLDPSCTLCYGPCPIHIFPWLIFIWILPCNKP